MPTHADLSLRNGLIRIASTLPKGSEERKSLLQILADFDPSTIGEIKPGPEGVKATPENTISDADKPWSDGEFTQQENVELHTKQEDGLIQDGKADDGPAKVASEKALFHKLVRLAHENKEARQPILAMLCEAGLIPCDKTAGCEKLPEGPMRDNCEKKKGEKKEEKPEEKKATSTKKGAVLITRQIIAAVYARRTPDGVTGRMILDFKNKSSDVEADAFAFRFSAVVDESNHVLSFSPIPAMAGSGALVLSRLFRELLQEALSTGRDMVRISRVIRVAVYTMRVQTGVRGRMVVDLMNKTSEGEKAFSVKFDAILDEGNIVSYIETIPSATGAGTRPLLRLYQEILQEAIGTGMVLKPSLMQSPEESLSL
jgi:hypothetical protein